MADDVDPVRQVAKLAAAAVHTAEQADLLEAGAEQADLKVEKAEAALKAAKESRAEARRVAKAARADASDWARKHREAADGMPVSVSAGAAEGRGAAS